MAFENDNGKQTGQQFTLKRRFYRSLDGKEVWTTPRAGVSVFVGGVGDRITMTEARKLKLAPAAKKKKPAAKAKK